MSSHIRAGLAPRLIEVIKPDVPTRSQGFKPLLMEHLAQRHKLISIPTTAARNVAHIGGDRSYILLGSLAKLETALMRWTINQLTSKFNFTPIVVPNILHDHIIEKCGFPTRSQRSQVYKISGTTDTSILDHPEANTSGSPNGQSRPCIAGTSEFALAAIHINESIPFDELPKLYCAMSRCYRAETSSTSSEWGVYRVHYFNKVEMLAFAMPDDSERVHEKFLHIQKQLFNQLDLHYQILDMPPDDLGLSAARKYDIEAWMNGRQRYGEISSTSNCRDYQSSRLNIKYAKMVERDEQLQIDQGFVHTVNGTACSSMRTLMAIVEQKQTEDGRIEIPDALIEPMGGVRYLPTESDAKLLAEVELYPETVK